MSQDYNQTKNLIAYTTIIICVILAGFTALAFSGTLKKTGEAEVTTSKNNLISYAVSLKSSSSFVSSNNLQSSRLNTTKSANTSANTKAGYKDGTYTKTEQYFIKGHNVTVTVKTTIAEGKINTAVVSAQSGTDHESQEYISYFNNEATSLKGKTLDEAKNYSVSGATLTSGAFYRALESISEEAKA